MVDDYKSVLAPQIRQLIKTKECAGRYTESLRYFFLDFDKFVMAYGLNAPMISRELIEAWHKT